MTDTDICNMALSYIGKGTITNKDEDIEDARACNLFYDAARCEILRAYPWGFAHRIERLALIDKEVPGWTYTYGYPDKCLKINKITEKTPSVVQYERFEIINLGSGTKAVITDLKNAYADYIWDVEDAELFDDLFVTAITHLLASKIAMRLTGNPQITSQEYQLYNVCMQNAKLQSAREEHQKPRFHSGYIAARRGGDGRG